MEFQKFFKYYKLVIAQIVIILFVIELFFVLWNTHMVQDVIEEVDEQSNATIKIFNTINNTNNDIKRAKQKYNSKTTYTTNLNKTQKQKLKQYIYEKKAKQSKNITNIIIQKWLRGVNTKRFLFNMYNVIERCKLRRTT